MLLLWPAARALAPTRRANLERFGGAVREVGPDEVAPALAGSGVVVDAIFGTGFSGAPRAPADAAIEAINGCGAPVVAADIASGVDASTGEVEGVAVRGRRHGELPRRQARALDRAGQGAHRRASGGRDRDPGGRPGRARRRGDRRCGARARAHRARPNSTKFDSGEVLVVGGSRGLTGAVCMAAEAAIRAGAGYATVAVPADLEPIFEVKLTEVMSRGFAGRGGPLGERLRRRDPRGGASARRPSSSARGWGATRTRSSWPARSPGGSRRRSWSTPTG